MFPGRGSGEASASSTQSLVVGGEGRGLPSSQCPGRPWSAGRSMWGCSEQRVWLISTWSRAPDHERGGTRRPHHVAVTQAITPLGEPWGERFHWAGGGSRGAGQGRTPRQMSCCCSYCPRLLQPPRDSPSAEILSASRAHVLAHDLPALVCPGRSSSHPEHLIYTFCRWDTNTRSFTR